MTTDYGPIDLLGEIVGGGTYNDLLPYSLEIVLWEQTCLVLGLEKLIDVKRAAGRPKDFEALAELEALREEIEAEARRGASAPRPDEIEPVGVSSAGGGVSRRPRVGRRADWIP